MSKFKIVKITNNIKKFPEYKVDTEEYPILIKYINPLEEIETFVICLVKNKFWTASYFFDYINGDTYEI